MKNLYLFFLIVLCSIHTTFSQYSNIKITEADTDPDVVEITNLGGTDVNISGLKVIVSQSNINSIGAYNSVTWNLSGVLRSGQVIYKNDNTNSGANYWGNNIWWANNYNGWVMIVDGSGNIIDAVFWGWQASDIATFSITVNGVNITTKPSDWVGNGLNSGCGGAFLRQGDSETNAASDFICSTASQGVFNTGLSLFQSIDIETTSANDITLNSSVCGGNIISYTGTPITERGVVYSVTDATPEIGENNVTKIIEGSTGLGIYSVNLSGLQKGTNYYYRAYAINNNGKKSYGPVKTFTTLDTQVINSPYSEVSKQYGSYFSPPFTASSGLPVTYTSDNPNVVKILNNKLYVVALGTANIKVSQKGNSSYVAASSKSFMLTATKRNLQVIGLRFKDKVYNGNTNVTFTGTPKLFGVISNDDVSIDGVSSASFKDKNAGQRKAIDFSGISLTGTDASKYVLAPSFSANISKKQITVTDFAVEDKTYDGTTNATLNKEVLLTGIVSGDVVSLKGTENITFKDKNVGVNKPININLELKGSDATNYILTQQPSLTGNITKKKVTVTANAASKTYGDTSPSLTYTTSPTLVSGDSFSGFLQRELGEDVGSYKINKGTLNSKNYEINFVSDDFTISKKAITITVDENQSKQYGDSDTNLTYNTNLPLVASDKATGSLQRKEGEDVGTYAITQGSLDLGANYKVTFVGANYSITKKEIVVRVNANQTKRLGDQNPVYSYTSTPKLLKNDTFTGALTREEGEEIGNYAITLGDLDAGDNYNITFVSNSFRIIGKKEQSITWNQQIEVGCSQNNEVELNAISDSGLPITYTVENTNIAVVEGTTLKFITSGITKITASQEGNDTYKPAKSIEITVSKLEDLLVQHWEDMLIFNNSSKKFVAWQWYKDGELIPEANKQYYQSAFALLGTYYVIATTKEGSKITTCTLDVKGALTLDKKGIKIYPNPVTRGQQFKVEMYYTKTQLNNAVLTLYDITGKGLLNKKVSSSTATLAAPNTSGIYIMSLLLSDGRRVSKNLLVK